MPFSSSGYSELLAGMIVLSLNIKSAIYLGSLKSMPSVSSTCVKLKFWKRAEVGVFTWVVAERSYVYNLE